jgi:hypothetical protein
MKTRYILLAVSALCAFSCTSIIEKELQPQSGERVTIKVSTSESLATKVSMTEASDRKAMKLEWEDADILSVNGNEFSVSNIISSHEAEFDGPAPGDGPYTIIYPGSYADAAAFNSRSYAAQAQSGNSSTAHLEYNAMLSGVSEYQEPKFDAGWAAEKGGALIQNGVVQLRLQLPDAVTAVSSVSLLASRDVFPTTNEGGVKVSGQTLSMGGAAPTNHIIEAYMMFSAAGVAFEAGDELSVIVETPDAMYVRTLPMTAQTWTGGGQYTIQCKVQTENSFEINNAADLETFRDGVNSGSLLWASCRVSLKADIDCSGLGSWTPIGNGTFLSANPYTVAGNSFRGVFDGENHILKNLQINGSPVENAPYGFFGVLDGATVKNLVFGAASGDPGFFKVTPSGIMEAGIVAGLARCSTIQNVTNYSPMSILENTSTGAAFFGMVGYAMGTADGKTHLDNVDNYGEVNAHTGKNTANGGSGMQVGGIVGFSNTINAGVRNLIENCDNHGNLTTSTGRVAGILAAANTRTELKDCVNRGNIHNTCTNARIAGICVIFGTDSSMSGCSNYGTVVATDNGANAGGLACLLNNANVTVSGGGNHGLIVCDHATYRGTLIANINTFASVDGLIAGGAVANYNKGEYEYPVILTDANYMSYIGMIKSGNESKVTNITFEAWDGYPAGNVTSISNAAQLLEFAAAVNAGTFTSADKAVLTADIDCSSITDWTPIGNGGMSAWTHNSLTTTGASFSGTFDGQGHSITNLAMNFSSSGSYAAYGFFGVIEDGATVKNLTFASTCSMNVAASYGSSFGVLAGLVKGATIQNIDNYAPITGGGTKSLGNNNAAGRTMVGAIIGEVHPNAVAANIEKLHNYADIGSSTAEFTRGNNPGNGANGFEVGGIAGFATTTAASLLTTLTDCVNDGDIYTNAGRSSGIVPAANRYTKLKDCINNGDVVSSVSGTYRLGNITCIAGEGSILDGCINNGDLTALGSVSVAGVVCLVNHATVQIKDCASLGATILGKSVNTAGAQTYNGVLFGLCDKAATFSGCRVSGVFGTSADDKVELTAENYFQFAGQRGTNCGASCNTTNITFAQ